MHYYKFHIGDYLTHTAHLDNNEDLAYRRMLDWLYLHERPLPDNINTIARLIRMPLHSESVRSVVDEFFELTDQGVMHLRVREELNAYQARRETGRKHAQKRWAKDGSAMGNPSDTQKVSGGSLMLTNNHKPITNKNTGRRFTPPTVAEVRLYCESRRNDIDPDAFVDHYQTNGWVQGKGKPIKDWKAAVRTWEKQRKEDRQSTPTRRSKIIDELTDRSWAE